MAKKSQLNNIYSIQKTCIKSICNQPKSSRILGLLKRHRLLKVEDIVELELGKFGYKLGKKFDAKTIEDSNGFQGRNQVTQIPYQKQTDTKYTEALFCCF